MAEAVQIGNATLYCGDCLEILPTLVKVDGIITDPPYSSGGRQQATARNIFSKADDVSEWTRSDEWFLGDNMGVDSYVRWMRQISKECFSLVTPGSPAYVFTDWRQFTNIVTAWETLRWTLRSVVVWDKDRGGAMGSYWRNNHEWICVLVKGKPRPLPNCSFYNTWKGTKPQGGTHPTEKPINLIRYLAESFGNTENAILDPFMGSGTTGIACAQIDRPFIGIEIEKKYFDIACERIENAQRQGRLFETTPSPPPTQTGLNLEAAP